MGSSKALGGVYSKRLSQEIEYRHDITNYDKDNLYPQKVNELLKRSPIANRATLQLSNFIRGGGFETNGEFVVNNNGDTMNDILRFTGDDVSKFYSYAVHINVNLVGQITELTYVPFEYLRLGMPDAHGKHKDIKLSVNWEKDRMKTTKRGVEKIYTYPTWGNWNDDARWGYIVYVTPRKDIYPLAVADPVLDSVQTDAEVQLFELGNIQNGFIGLSFFRAPYSTEGSSEKADNMSMIQDMQGAEGANGIGYVELPSDFDGPLIETIPALNNDSLFTKTTDNVLKRILLNYSMPKGILGIEPDGGMFNIEQIEQQYIYYNVQTRDIRKQLSEDFNELMKFWHTGPVPLGKIKENRFIIETGTAEVEPIKTPENG